MAATWSAPSAPTTSSRRPLLISLLFGAVAAFLVFKLVSSAQPSSAPVAGVPVVVAKQDIAARTVITGDMVGIKSVPASLKLATAFTDTKTLVGQVARQPISAGEQLLSSKVATSANELGFSGQVPDGLRGISVQASEVAADGGMIQPSDHVDVIAIFQEIDAVPDTQSLLVRQDETKPKKLVSSTIAQNVLVLAVGQAVTDPSAKSGSTKAQPDVKTVTLAVTPDQAQKIFLGDSAGTLRLSLHRFDDAQTADLATTQNSVTAVLPDDTQPAPIANTARVVPAATATPAAPAGSPAR